MMKIGLVAVALVALVVVAIVITAARGALKGFR
jgi:hypothetical protein